MKKSVISFVLLILLTANYTWCLNILGIFPYHGKSHFIVFRIYLRELAIRGHNVTIISHYPEEDPPKNYHDISLSGITNSMELEEPLDMTKSLLRVSLNLAYKGTANCKTLLANKLVHKLITDKVKFDVIIVEQYNSDCALGIAYKLKAPVVGTSSHILMPYHHNRFGVLNNVAFVPFHFLEGGTKPTLYQRVERVIFDILFKFIYYFFCQRIDQNTLAQYFDNIPPLEHLARDIKFHLVYHHFVLSGSQLFPSNVIEVGGYHIRDAKPLTGNLKQFMDEAEHGVIYISFGSRVKTSTMPADKLQVVLEIIREMPQKFVWKWEDQAIMFDKNKLYTAKWLPQVDILGHPKTLVFWSHAGNGGTTEAIHFGIPMIASPVFGDQPANAAAIEESGLGLCLPMKKLTKEKLLKVLNQVLDSKFQRRVKDISKAWHDRPMSPLDTAVYWTEYAARHSNSTFRTAAADVPFYQYYNLDVAVILGVLISLLAVMLRVIIKTCWKLKKYIESIPEIKKKRA